MKPDIEIKAAEWVARLDASPDSAQLRAEFHAWRAADPANEAAWLRLSSAWGRLDRLAALRPGSDEVDADLLAPVRPMSRRNRWALAAAASLIVAAVAIGYLAAPSIVNGNYATRIGERRVVKLEDSTSVSLNTASDVKVRYRDTERRVEIREGEALFKVAKDPARPFVVHVRDLQVRAVGTAFAVRVKPEGVEVAVTEGVVEITSERDHRADRLSAGQIALYSGSRGIVRSAPAADLERKLAWENGMIAFDGEPLSEAIEEFNRYNTHKIVISDPKIAGLRVGGYFRSDDVSGFIGALEASFDLKAEPGDAVTYLAAGS